MGVKRTNAFFFFFSLRRVQNSTSQVLIDTVERKQCRAIAENNPIASCFENTGAKSEQAPLLRLFGGGGGANGPHRKQTNSITIGHLSVTETLCA